MRQEPILAVFGLLLAACGASATNLVPEEPIPATVHAKNTPATKVKAEPVPADDVPPVTFAHAVGDYIVRRFSLRSRGGPTVLLTERVVAVKDASIVLEVTRETGAEKRSVRVELGSEPANRGEVLTAKVLRDGREISMGKVAYDAIMKGTVFAADQNEGPIESARIKLDVHGRTVDCTETRFRVRVRGRAGTMRTIELENSPWGEVAGDVTTADGAVLYRAEVLDVGHDELRTAAVQGN